MNMCMNMFADMYAFYIHLHKFIPQNSRTLSVYIHMNASLYAALRGFGAVVI